MIVSPVPFEGSVGVLVTCEPILQALSTNKHDLVQHWIRDNLDLVFYIDNPCDTLEEGLAWARAHYQELASEIKRELIKPKLLN